MSNTPRIYTRCPACGNDTLTINNDKHLLCTWIKCPNPTLIDDYEQFTLTKASLASALAERDKAKTKCKETAKDFETAFRLVRQENDTAIRERDEARKERARYRADFETTAAKADTFYKDRNAALSQVATLTQQLALKDAIIEQRTAEANLAVAMIPKPAPQPPVCKHCGKVEREHGPSGHCCNPCLSNSCTFTPVAPDDVRPVVGERPTPITDEAVARIEKKHTHVAKNVVTHYKAAFIELGFEMADMELKSHAPMAYETPVEVQCEATATSNARIAELEARVAHLNECDNNTVKAWDRTERERDAALSQVAELKEETAKIVAVFREFRIHSWEQQESLRGQLAAKDSDRISMISELGELHAQLDTTQKQNAAKDEALSMARDSYELARLTKNNPTYSAIVVALSPSAGNQFVRREVLDELVIATKYALNRLVNLEDRAGYVKQAIESLRAALTRAESALKTGGQEG